ncbi:type 4a pilus biogenesis protein PilO [Patescibacteria group bacterium]
MNRERTIIYIGVSAVIALIIFLFLARPAFDDMVESKQDLDDTNIELAEKQQEADDLRTLINDFNSTAEADKDSLDAHVPARFNQADILAQLEAIGKGSRALLEEVQFANTESDEEDDSGVTVVKANATVTGTYEQIRGYIESLEQSKRIMNIDQLNLDSDGTTVEAFLSFKLYFKDAGLEKEPLIDLEPTENFNL